MSPLEFLSKTGYQGKLFLSKKKDSAHIFPLSLQLCRITTVGLFVAASLAIARQMFGDPIKCTWNSEGNADVKDLAKAVENYCWQAGTFTIANTPSEVRMKLRKFYGLS